MKRIFYFLIGLIAWLSLLCSIAATAVTNEALMNQGFLQFSQTAHLGISPRRYGDYAHGLCQYLDGKTAAAQIKDAETGEGINAFSDRENAHLQDVRGIVQCLKAARYVGGGLVIAALALLYFLQKRERPRMLLHAVHGFSHSALFLLLLATVLAVWGIVNFDGLFVTFHKVAFTNDLWLLNPNTDVLLALMPLPFFTWYVVEILKSMLPVLVMMALVIVASTRIGKTQKETEKQ